MNRRIAAYSTTALLLLSTSALIRGQEIENTSFIAADGTRVLRHEIVVEASQEQVWQAFTTSEGWISWAAPVAFVDFRRGGTIETSYDPDAEKGDPANIRHEILSYVPGEMLSTRVTQTPPDFPHRELTDSLWSVFTFEDVGEGRTRITSAGMGYGEGDGYDTIYGFFEQGNAMMLQQLDRRLQEGPVDWSAALAAITQHTETGGGDDGR